ncbi:MAG TPA: FadR/GntR family transcriptional regulator [Ramlibacter sp.]|nr:FadR/GntR family transcriptional regulator [Ramlibacter sp.]
MSVTKSILDLIQERNLQPGDRLPSERDLAHRWGIGRNALREALAGLITLRVLEAKPNSGVYLRRVSTDSSFETLATLAELGATPSGTEISESTEVRLALEALVVQLACVRRTEYDLDALNDVQARTESALREHANIAELDTEFHLALVAATHNSILVRVLNSFYLLTATRRQAWFENGAQAKSSSRDHRKIIDAIEQRDTDAARQLIARHMNRATLYWQEVLG